VDIRFGKHKGQSVDTVFRADPGYLWWLSGQPWVAEKFTGLLLEIQRVLGIEEEGRVSSEKALREQILEALVARGRSPAEAERIMVIWRRLSAKQDAP